MTDYTTYGTLLKRATVVVGEVVSLDSPELIQDAAESTNHSSSGWRTFIASGLKEVSEFSATLNYVATGLDTLMGDWSAGTSSAYTITYLNADVFTFNALVTKIKPLGADSQNPEVLKAEVTFRPTGSATLT